MSNSGSSTKKNINTKDKVTIKRKRQKKLGGKKRKSQKNLGGKLQKSQQNQQYQNQQYPQQVEVKDTTGVGQNALKGFGFGAGFGFANAASTELFNSLFGE